MTTDICANCGHAKFSHRGKKTRFMAKGWCVIDRVPDGLCPCKKFQKKEDLQNG